MSASPFSAGGQIASTVAGATRYVPVAGMIRANITEAAVGYAVPVDGVVRSLAFYIASSPSGTLTCTLRKNSSDTAAAVVFGSSESGYKEDTGNPVSCVAGDIIDIAAVHASGVSVQIWGAGAIYEPTDYRDTVSALIATESTLSTSTASTTFFSGPSGAWTFTAGEANLTMDLCEGGVLRRFGVYVSSNARTTDTIFRVRKNLGNGNGTVTFGASETGTKEDTSNTDTFARDDRLAYSTTTGSGSGAITVQLARSSLINADGRFVIGASGSGLSPSNGQTRYAFLQEVIGAGSIFIHHSPMTFKMRELSLRVASNSLNGDTEVVLYPAGSPRMIISGGATGVQRVLTDQPATAGVSQDMLRAVAGGSSGSIAITQAALWGWVPPELNVRVDEAQIGAGLL